MKVFLLTESENGLCFLFDVSSICFEGLIGTTLEERVGEADVAESLEATCLRKSEHLFLSVSISNCLAS